MPPAHTQPVPETLQRQLVDWLCCPRGDPPGPLLVRMSEEVEYDFGTHCVDPWCLGAVLQGEAGGRPLPVPYCAWHGYHPRAGEVGHEGCSACVLAGPTSWRVGGGMASGHQDIVVSAGVEPPRDDGVGVSPDIRVGGGQVVYAQGHRAVWVDRRVVAELDPSPGNGACQ